MQLHTPSVLARLADFDARLCVCLNRAARRRPVRRLFGLVSRLGDGVFWYMLMGVLLFLHGKQALGPVTHMILVGLAGLLIYKWLKQVTGRPRPCDLHPTVERGSDPLDQFSFPSGHTLHAVAFTLVALAYFPALAPLLVPFTVLVALSRVVLGLHYPTDVLAGAAIGYGVATLSFAL